MYSRFQFQTKTEPFHFPDMDPPIDRWAPRLPDGRSVVKMGLSLAIMAGSCFSPIDTSGSVLPGSLPGGTSLYGARQYQYQASAEPVTIPSAPAFVPSVDKYQAISPITIPLRPRTITAIDAGSCFYVRYHPLVETVTIDKWMGEEPVAARRAASLSTALHQSVATREVTSGETITLDKLKVTVPDMYPSARVLPAAITSGSSFGDPAPATEIPRLERWTTVAPDYIYQKARIIAAIEAGSFFYYPEDLRPPWLNQFAGTFPDLIPRALGLRTDQQMATGMQLEPPTETISPDKWLPLLPDLIRKKADWRLGEYAWYPLEIIPVVTPDMFVGQFPDYLFKRTSWPPGAMVAIEATPYTSGTDDDLWPKINIRVWVWKRTS